MDVKAGATVGFTTVLGGLGGALVGFLIADAGRFRDAGKITSALSTIGALTGAFVGGTMVAATPAAAATGTAAPAFPGTPQSFSQEGYTREMLTPGSSSATSTTMPQ